MLKGSKCFYEPIQPLHISIRSGEIKRSIFKTVFVQLRPAVDIDGLI